MSNDQSSADHAKQLSETMQPMKLTLQMLLTLFQQEKEQQDQKNQRVQKMLEVFDEQLRAIHLVIGLLASGEPLAVTPGGNIHMDYYVQQVRLVDAEAAARKAAAEAEAAAAAMAASLPETPQRAYDLVFGGNGS